MPVRIVQLLSFAVALLVVIPASAGKSGTYTVRRGDTLTAIAKRHHLTVSQLCKLNHISRNRRIRPGLKLKVSTKPVATPKRKSSKSHHDAKPKPIPPPANPSVQTLEVRGAPNAYYYEPTGRGRLSRRPIIVYLHGRGGNPKRDCMRWARIARPYGWLLCPSGPEERGEGRGWANNWPAGQRVVMASVKALVRKYPKRVQRYGNTLIGFSEGAFVAMNIGPRQSRTFNRWFILAADTKYWGALGRGLLARARRRVKRVYLITGEQDGTFHPTERVARMLRRARIPVRVETPKDMGHQVLLETRPQLYRSALQWLAGRGGKAKRTKRVRKPVGSRASAKSSKRHPR